MKRNLFAIFLAVMLVAALVIVAAPNSKAADANVITAVADTEYKITDNSKVFDLNGQKNVTVDIADGVTLSVIDSANMELDGSTAGELTKTGDGKIASVTLYGNYRYLAVETDGKYAFHPFNMAITRRGVNTKQKTISLEAQFVANNVVRDMITDFGIKNITKNTCHSAKPNFDFEKEYADGDGVSNNTKNGAKAYYDLVGSLEKDALEEERIFCAYIKINGIDEPIFGNQRVDVTPEKVLTNINGNFNNFTHKQKTLMSEMVKGTDYLETLCGSFATFTGKLPIDSSFSLVEGGTQHYEFEGIEASKNYYIQFTLSAPTTAGYVGVAHWGDEQNYFYDVVSYDANENYRHEFAGIVNGAGKVSTELAKYFEGETKTGLTGADFGANGMTITSAKIGDRVYTFINGVRIATYLIESKLAVMETIPVLYFYDRNGNCYDGEISNITIDTDEADAIAKVAELDIGNVFNYANTPNWNKNGGLHTDASFDKNSFTYTYDGTFDLSACTDTKDRRFMTGVHDRVFLGGDYYYEYEVTGDMTYVTELGDWYGLFFNWINTTTPVDPESIYYRHEANFVLKLNKESQLDWLTFAPGSGTNGDGVSNQGSATHWATKNTEYGGSITLASDEAWQAVIKDGVIVRIERTVINSNTDAFMFTITSKSNPEVKLVSTKAVETTHDVYGGYNWILFGTQSVNCTVSNVSFGSIHSHSWEYTSNWNALECTATRTCATCGETETETATGKLSASSIPATKTTAGTLVYEAAFDSAAFRDNVAPYVVEVPANTAFSLPTGGKQCFAFDAISASKNYYVEIKLSAPTTAGYVGVAHWADADNYFYDVVSYDATENYYHAFASAVNGAGRVYEEPAKYYEGKTVTDFGTNGMTITSVRTGDRIYTFINGVRIATYLIEEELAAMDLVPALYFCDRSGNYYNGEISNITIVTGETEAIAKVAELTTGSSFDYVNTPNFDLDKQNGSTKNVHTDATFNDNGFTYAYDATVSVKDRRFATGVGDRVFMTGNYYYQYEISGDIVASTGSNVYGLFYNWINTKTLSEYTTYRHEANFVLKMNGTKLQRLTFAPGSGSNGDGLKPDGSADWVSNTTAYGGNNTLESDTAWQTAFKSGLIVRIEHTVVDGDTDSFVISVTTKDGAKTLTSTAMEVSDVTFGGYTWVQFGTQSVECTVSNVEFGHK